MFFSIVNQKEKLIMIEIKISTSAAVLLITERMRFEFGLRKKVGKIEIGFEIENLSYKSLLSIAETAAFDLVLLLPADILTDNNNLDDIICRSMRTLADIYNKAEFKYYTKEKARKLLKPIKDLFSINKNTEIFSRN